MKRDPRMLETLNQLETLFRTQSEIQQKLIESLKAQLLEPSLTVETETTTKRRYKTGSMWTPVELANYLKDPANEDVMLKAFEALGERTFPGMRDRIGFNRKDETQMLQLFRRHRGGEKFDAEIKTLILAKLLKYIRQLTVLANERIIAKSKPSEYQKPEFVEPKQLELELQNK